MEDTFDVLQISRETKTPSRKRARKPKRPDGISREAYSLIDVHHPVVQGTPSLSKQLRPAETSKSRLGDTSYNVSYQRRAFKNGARTDGLELTRWVKCYTDGQGNYREAQNGEFQFARCNVPPNVVCYSESEWNRFIAPLSTTWSKEETNYLLDLCQRYSLRFVVVQDRYQYSERSVEELKERYYAIAHCLAVVRSGEEPSSRFMQRNPYDAFYEKKRRDACRTMYEMTIQEEMRDKAILEEAEKIETKRLEGAEISLSLSSDDASSDSFSQLLTGQFVKKDDAPLHDAEGNPWVPPAGVYVRGMDTKKLVAQGNSASNESLSEQKVSREFSLDKCFPTVCSKKLMKAWIDLHNDANLLAKLRDTINDSEETSAKNLNS